jgi:hypothetical protein
MHTLICKFYTLICKIYTLICKFYTLICKIHTLICKFYSLICKIYTLICKFYTLICKIYTLIFQFYTLICKIYTLICKFYTLICKISCRYAYLHVISLKTTMFQEIPFNSFRGESLIKTLPTDSRTGQKHYTLRNFVAWGIWISTYEQSDKFDLDDSF